MSFAENLAMGQLGESLISRWLRSRGSFVMPAYEKEIDTGKGPRLFCPNGQLVTPDLFTFPAMEFVEAKHKSVFTWHHKSGKWTTGIDLHHYEEYRLVEEQTGRRVWLFFLHREATPNKIDMAGRTDCAACEASPGGTCCPERCPTGLFGGSLRYLSKNESHRSGKHGSHGMVYWAAGTLTLHAPIEDIEGVAT